MATEEVGVDAEITTKGREMVAGGAAMTTTSRSNSPAATTRTSRSATIGPGSK